MSASYNPMPQLSGNRKGMTFIFCNLPLGEVRFVVISPRLQGFFKQGSIRKLYQRKYGPYGDLLAPTAKLSLLDPMADKVNRI